MKTIPVTDFRKNASSFIDEVEHGETLILIRRGRPVAEIIPFSKSKAAICRLPYWTIVRRPYESGG